MVKQREHIASVLCVTSTASPESSDRKMIISGGEDSIIQVSSVASDGGSGCTPPEDSSTGEGHNRVARIDHHRGPVTCAVVNHRNDVLVSGRLSPHQHYFHCCSSVVAEKLHNLSFSRGASANPRIQPSNVSPFVGRNLQPSALPHKDGHKRWKMQLSTVLRIIKL